MLAIIWIIRKPQWFGQKRNSRVPNICLEWFRPGRSSPWVRGLGDLLRPPPALFLYDHTWSLQDNEGLHWSYNTIPMDEPLTIMRFLMGLGFFYRVEFLGAAQDRSEITCHWKQIHEQWRSHILTPLSTRYYYSFDEKQNTITWYFAYAN